MPSDDAQLLRLLWREEAPSRRGPRQRLTIDAVVEAATALADRDGLDAITMRSVAGRLGASAMTIYTYVPGKPELIQLMVDNAYTRMPRSAYGRLGWRRRLTLVAQDNVDLYAAHPWLVDVTTARPPMGPGVMAKYEHELQALTSTDLDDVRIDDVLSQVLAFAHSAARVARDAASAAAQSGMADEEWWEQVGPLLAKVLDPAIYPTATRIGQAAGEAHGSALNPDQFYRFGLERLLDGIAAIVP
ncbi:TetR/AcrR family transcriptional regulator [Luteipulveratus mongoliensis]|uniref:TetR family transcriptional regulator n=1 Tax=Luteipulveratus mongoliensis TaxID=571913 RepID=A0A0K1JLT3_9MICO|nr:TetR/AcrR family transcriptional regulator [Luteipulveratus mongoliensis]AKU17672.1 TetR family transcriptional regulator [Luteipulveratus mongoliensis]